MIANKAESSSSLLTSLFKYKVVGVVVIEVACLTLGKLINSYNGGRPGPVGVVLYFRYRASSTTVILGSGFCE